jgi:lipopolysaccharide export system protein LptA
VTSDRLTYTDSERRAHFEGSNVVAKGAGVVTSAAAMDVFLEPAGSDQRTIAQSNTGKIDHIIASGSVVVSQPGRRAAGDRLVYTASEDKFVMTGGPPSIFDAEHGKITGVSLTFFRGDDRVVIEGSQALPTVTQTRVAR